MAELAYGSYTQFSGGMNSAFDPAGIEPDQYMLGVNVVNRGGIIRPRPSFLRVAQTFTTPADRELFRRGIFQGSAWYHVGGRDYAVLVISGLLFVVDLGTGVTYNMSATAERVSLNERAPMCWFCEAEGNLIIQDGTSNPVIMSGINVRHADPDKNEVPPGTAMAYGHGRLFVATGTRAIIAGNINDPTRPDEVLKFTETDEINLGGYLAPGSDTGDITTLFFLANVDTSTGTGPLVVAGTEGMVSFRVDVPRAEWTNVVFRKFLVGENGPVSAWSATAMNSDRLYWSTEGLRSLSVMLSEVTNARRFVNLSKEVAAIYQGDAPDLWRRCSMAVADGRVLFTVNPRMVKTLRFGQEVEDEDLAYRSIISLDFDHLKGKAFQGQYVATVGFDGVWTGPLVLQLLSRHGQAYIIGKDEAADGAFNAVFKISDRQTGMDDLTPIRCRLLTRGMVTDIEPDYQPAPFIRKQYVSTAVWFREVENNVPVQLYLSVDDSPFFTRIADTELKAPTVIWDEATIEIPQAGEAHSFPGYRFPNPPFACDPVTGGTLFTGYTFQLCLDWEGKAAFSRMLLTASRDPKTSEDPCPRGTRKLMQSDGRPVLTINPFNRLDAFYHGDTGWYDRQRTSFGPTPAPTGASFRLVLLQHSAQKINRVTFTAGASPTKTPEESIEQFWPGVSNRVVTVDSREFFYAVGHPVSASTMVIRRYSPDMTGTLIQQTSGVSLTGVTRPFVQGDRLMVPFWDRFASGVFPGVSRGVFSIPANPLDISDMQLELSLVSDMPLVSGWQDYLVIARRPEVGVYFMDFYKANAIEFSVVLPDIPGHIPMKSVFPNENTMAVGYATLGGTSPIPAITHVKFFGWTGTEWEEFMTSLVPTVERWSAIHM